MVHVDQVWHSVEFTNVSWSGFVDRNFVWPCVVVAICLAISIPLQLVYEALLKVKTARHFIHNFIGTPSFQQVKWPLTVVLLYLIQLVCSLSAVGIWWRGTYSFQIYPIQRQLLRAQNVFFIVHWFFLQVRAGLKPSGVFSTWSLIDIFTVVPFLLHGESGIFDKYNESPQNEQWMTLVFLRSFRAVQAYDHMEQMADMRNIPVILRRVFLLVLKGCAMTISMAGVMITLEVLGEVPGWEDKFITITRKAADPGNDTSADLSPWQMYYWIVTTISTVGYGDFSPTLGHTRLLLVVFIVIGGIFFTVELGNLLSLKGKLNQGGGNYVKSANVNHIVVVGEQIGMGTPFMQTFLSEIFYLRSETRHTDVVILSEEPYSEELLNYVNEGLSVAKRRHVYMLVGSAIYAEDLERVRLKDCIAAYTLPDHDGTNAEKTDGQNIMRTLSMLKHCPDLHYRIMLLAVPSKHRAISMGLAPHSCISGHALKADMAAQSTRIRGFLPFCLGLLKELDRASEDKPLRAGLDDPNKDPADVEMDRAWLFEHLHSLRSMIRGLLCGPAIADMEFSEAAAYAYEKSEGKVLLIGVYNKGTIQLNWSGKDALGSPQKLWQGQVLLAIAPKDKDDEFHLAPFEEKGDWRHEFHMRRMERERKGKTATEETSQVRNFRKSIKMGEHVDVAEAVFLNSMSMFPYDGFEQKAVMKKGTTRIDRAKVHGHPSIVTVIVSDDRLWDLVEKFLDTLRNDNLLVHQPVVVLSIFVPPSRISHHFSQQGVLFRVGPHKLKSTIEKVNLHKSQTVIVFRDLPTGTEQLGSRAVYSDSKMLIQCSMIEKYLLNAGSKGFRIYEFGTTDALRIFQAQWKPRRQGMLHSASLLVVSAHSEKPSRQRCAEQLCRKLTTKNPLWRLPGQVAKACRTFGKAKEADLEYCPPNHKLVFQRLFASGQAFCGPELFAVAFAASHYLPFAFGFLNALCMTRTNKQGGQEGFVWQVKCPPSWAEKNFGDFQLACLRQKDETFMDCGPVLSLAVYRSAEDLRKSYSESNPESPISTSSGNDTIRGLNITLPEFKFKLLPGDLITCLGSRTFGEKAQELGLLDTGESWKTCCEEFEDVPDSAGNADAGTMCL